MSKKSRLAVFFISSLLIVGYLFYIDEGNYNFDWLTHGGSLLIYLLYVLVVFAGQVVVSEVFLKSAKSFGRFIWSILLGPFLGATAIMFVLFVVVQVKNLFS